MNYKDFNDIIEQVKDVICSDIEGKIFDWHVADELNMTYDSLRTFKAKNKIIHDVPIVESKVVDFCFRKEINVYEFLVKP